MLIDRLLIFALGACVALGGTRAAEPIDFAHEIVPILRQHCVECHGGREAKGGFSINTRALMLESGVAIPGDASGSYFLELVRSEDPDMQMPPQDQERVPEAQIAVLDRWVRAGMPWPEQVTFNESTYQAPLLPREVDVPQSDRADNPIDRILSVSLQSSGDTTLEAADDSVFLRRASLDLIGLLPSPEALQNYRSDSSPERRRKAVDRLLSRDVDYAEHWLTFWNDLLRNDYTGTGFITGGRKQISHWLYESLVQNKPFDQFTRELISPPSDASRGFIDGIQWRGAVSAGQSVEIQFAQNLGQAFLGINLKCASCHDSFIDRWKLSDAYSLAAIYATEPLEIHRCDQPIGQTASPGWLFPELGTVDADAPRPQRLEQLSRLVTDAKNGRYARTIVNRLWTQLMGRGIVHPPDAMHTRPWNEDLLDFLANYLAQHDYDLKAVLRLIATSDAYAARTESLEGDPANESNYVFQGPRPKRMTAEQFMDAVWTLTESAPSEFDAPVIRGKVDPESLASLDLEGRWIWGGSAASQAGPAGGERLTFRTSVTLPANVRGGAAVITADNAFTLYLGGRRVASGDDWTRVQTVPLVGRLKKGDNKIVIVAENGSDRPNPAGVYFEARVRLDDGSQVRIASGDDWEFSESLPSPREGRLGNVGGPWKPVTIVEQPAYQRVREATRQALAGAISDSDRMVRAALMNSDFLMRSLGRPNRDQIVSTRPGELTTLEAVDLSAGEILAKDLADGARMWHSKQFSTRQLARRVYLQAFSREPTTAEYDAIISGLGQQPSPQAIEDFLWVVCVMPEFMVIR